jgi:NADPH:quinone reductase-like Zn-dependent oxidoreductase
LPVAVRFCKVPTTKGADVKAIVCTRYGPPEVLQLQEVPNPVPKDNEILIKIYATTVTRGDVTDRTMALSPLFWLPTRMIFGLTKPRRKIPGGELAGEVVAVGKNVKRFEEGEHVFGSPGWGSGAYAEYIALPESGVLATKPTNMTYEEAAALTFGGGTALHFLRRANIKSGQRVLVYGASGSVGTFAVQLAKYHGAEVTAVCSTANLELVKSLGADRVIDYTKQDFANNSERYDVIFDAVSRTSFSHCKSSLTQRGIYLSVGGGLMLILHKLWASIASSKKVIFGIANPKAEDLRLLKKPIKAGEVISVIDRSYPLEQIADAHRYVERDTRKAMSQSLWSIELSRSASPPGRELAN